MARRPPPSRAAVAMDRLESEAEARPPAAPTAALPGTPAKVAVLVRRAQLRQELFHPRDAGTRACLPTDLRLVWQRTANGKNIALGTEEIRMDPGEKAAEVPTFGLRLALAMEAGGWSAYKLAEQTGVSRQTISRLVNDEREPGLGVLLALAEALGVSLDELAGRKTG